MGFWKSKWCKYAGVKVKHKIFNIAFVYQPADDQRLKYGSLCEVRSLSAFYRKTNLHYSSIRLRNRWIRRRKWPLRDIGNNIAVVPDVASWNQKLMTPIVSLLIYSMLLLVLIMNESLKGRILKISFSLFFLVFHMIRFRVNVSSETR